MTSAEAIGNGLVTTASELYATTQEVYDGITNGTITVAAAVADGLIGAPDAIANGFVDLDTAIVNGLITGQEAIAAGLVSAWDALDSGIITVAEALDLPDAPYINFTSIVNRSKNHAVRAVQEDIATVRGLIYLVLSPIEIVNSGLATGTELVEDGLIPASVAIYEGLADPETLVVEGLLDPNTAVKIYGVSNEFIKSLGFPGLPVAPPGIFVRERRSRLGSC